MSTNDRLRAAGEAAVAAATAAWQRTIVEPTRRGTEHESARWIDSIIRTPAGLGWSWMTDEFDVGTEFEWCGAFASFAWGAAGLALDLRSMYFSSTSRLACYAAYQPHFGTTKESALRARYPRPAREEDRRVRLVLDEHSTEEDLIGVEPRAGDILLVGHPGSRYGTHVTVVESWDPERCGFHTIEGNARGLWPDGKRRPGIQGVTKNFRPLGLAAGESGYHARRLIRPALHDIAETAP